MLVRADASVENGTGHVMRCIALAQAFKAGGGRCTFVSYDLPIALASRLNDEGFDNIALTSPPGSPEDAHEFGALADKLNTSWTAIDGYHFSNTYCQAVKKYGHRLIFIDDSPGVSCDCADIVLSPNSSVDPSLCPVPNRPRLLSGFQYTLLRQEFWNGGKARRYPRIARRLLVSLGGSDPTNVTATILRCLAKTTV
jgi:UDP-2,4-diacetamido-2,4,6-trideoxy-beta-L-altropyranose hydrolase